MTNPNKQASDIETREVRGWSYVGGRKHHYWADANTGRRSLCGRWVVLSPDASLFFDDKHDSPDNCAACARIRLNLTPAPQRAQEARGEVDHG